MGRSGSGWPTSLESVGAAGRRNKEGARMMNKERELEGGGARRKSQEPGVKSREPRSKHPGASSQEEEPRDEWRKSWKGSWFAIAWGWSCQLVSGAITADNL